MKSESETFNPGLYDWTLIMFLSRLAFDQKKKNPHSFLKYFSWKDIAMIFELHF